MMRLLPFTIVLLWIVLAILALGNTSALNLQFLDDQAFLMGTAETVRRGELLLSGLPSHLGARHLGPYYVYLQAALSWIGDSDPVVVSLLFTTLKLLTPLVLVLALVVTINQRSAGYLAGLFVMLASLSGYTIAILRMDWVNYFLVLVSSLLTLAVVRVVKKGVSALPFLILASTLVIQPHLSPLPIVGAAWAGVMLYLICFRPESKPCSRVKKIVCITTALVLWLPALAYEVLYERNIFAILGHNLGKRTEGGGLLEISTVVVEFIAEVITGGRGTLPPVLITTWSALCILLLAGRALRGQRTERVCIGIALLQCVAMAIALTQVKPPVHHYYLISLYGPLLYLWGLAAQEASEVVYQFVHKRCAPFRIPMSIPAVLVLGIFAYVWMGNLPHLRAGAWSQLAQPYFSLAHAREVSKIISADAGGLERVKIVTRGGVRLSANAYYYHISPELLPEFMYAPRMIELPVIQKEQPPFERGYLIDCGIDALPEAPTLGRRLKNKWSLADEVNLSSCGSCAQCRMWRLMPMQENSTVNSGSE